MTKKMALLTQFMVKPEVRLSMIEFSAVITSYFFRVCVINSWYIVIMVVRATRITCIRPGVVYVV